MPFLQFLPWCPLDRAYEIGEVTLVPFAIDADTPGVGEIEAGQVRSILAAYHGIDGLVVSKAALIRFEGRPILAEISEDERDLTRELVQLACFSGLANRTFFNPIGPYCNADCFIWYGQRFQDKVDGVGIVHRRREGQTLAFRTLDRTVFSIPEQVSTIRDVTLDLGLIAALLGYRESSQASDWGRWQNAISCFNQANTDGQGTSPQLESVLMCSAFERLLDAAPKDKDVAKLLSGALIPSKTIPASESSRRVSRQADKNNSLRYEWMREFYTVRGNFAHGNFKTAQPMKWTPEEHLVLAAISFPLCVKVLLQRMEHYSMTDSDLIQTDAFEALANQAAFLGEPSDSTGSMDSWWARHLSEARRIRRRQKMVESLRALKGENNG